MSVHFIGFIGTSKFVHFQDGLRVSATRYRYRMMFTPCEKGDYSIDTVIPGHRTFVTESCFAAYEGSESGIHAEIGIAP
ncbi:MAG TPA: hypothetical protein VE291_09710 [Terracidiphilus sp.]|jgi:hypothetical protein|nr:hypothetical protein [Terracidiphilus sp.]